MQSLKNIKLECCNNFAIILLVLVLNQTRQFCPKHFAILKWEEETKFVKKKLNLLFPYSNSTKELSIVTIVTIATMESTNYCSLPYYFKIILLIYSKYSIHPFYIVTIVTMECFHLCNDCNDRSFCEIGPWLRWIDADILYLLELFKNVSCLSVSFCVHRDH